MTAISPTRAAAEWARALFVSPEFLVIILIGWAFLQWPETWTAVRASIGPSGGVVGLGGLGAAVALLTTTGTQMKRITHPDDPGRVALLDWPEYWRLSIRVRAGYLFSMVGAASVATGLAVGWSSPESPWALVALVLGLGVQLVAFATMTFAAWQVGEVLDGV